jgi:uncharacterized integral membrane protein
MKKNTLLLFNPESSLFSLPIVRNICFVSLSAAILVAIIIASNSKLDFCWSSIGFNFALDAFKVPLGILALGLTLIGICGANHRSEQTRRQIERTATQITLTNKQISITEGQNLFSNYYKHVEEFEKFCEKHAGTVKVGRPRSLYRVLFPRSKAGEYSISVEAIEQISLMSVNFIDAAMEMNITSSSEAVDGLIKLGRFREEALKDYNLLYTEGMSGTTLSDSKGDVFIPHANSRALVEKIIEILKKIDEICHFDVDYKTPGLLAILLNIDTTKIPTRKITESFEGFDIRNILKESQQKMTIKNPEAENLIDIVFSNTRHRHL